MSYIAFSWFIKEPRQFRGKVARGNHRTYSSSSQARSLMNDEAFNLKPLAAGVLLHVAVEFRRYSTYNLINSWRGPFPIKDFSKDRSKQLRLSPRCRGSGFRSFKSFASGNILPLAAGAGSLTAISLLCATLVASFGYKCFAAEYRQRYFRPAVRRCCRRARCAALRCDRANRD
eukprot:6212225-Pleurochrysis_carterae.AAC.2